MYFRNKYTKQNDNNMSHRQATLCAQSSVNQLLEVYRHITTVCSALKCRSAKIVK